jgi:hypothetical protein
MNDLKPKVQRQMGGFENGPLPNGEGLLALVALAEPEPSGFAL